MLIYQLLPSWLAAPCNQIVECRSRKCVGRQCNTLISRIVIVWSSCMKAGIELVNASKSNSLGFGELSPCKCGSYFWMHTFGLIIVVWIQPMQVQPQTLTTSEHQYVAKPNDFMMLSALTLLCCCCWPAFILAIVSMIYSAQVLAL